MDGLAHIHCLGDLDGMAEGALMNLIDVHKQFATDEQCLAYLEQMRWPKGERCVTCGNDKLSKVTRDVTKKGKNQRITFYQCLEPTCKQQFSPTAGTIFHDSHLPLHKWFLALALIVDAKKGISAKQLQRHLGIGSYRTAWYLAHRIRKAMEESEGSLMKGIVEVDETYIGGKQKGMPGRQSEGTNPCQQQESRNRSAATWRRIATRSRARFQSKHALQDHP